MKIRGTIGGVFLLIALLLTASPRLAQASTPIQGIDVSKWQGTIDWEAVKEDGIEFVMIGTGRYKSGTATPDAMFEKNIQGAIDAGIYVGIYHYATVTTVEDARNAADYVLNLVDGYKISYPIAIDMEDSVYSSMTAAKRSKIAVAFMEVIADAGYYPMIYASNNYFTDSLDLSILSGYDYWVATWSAEPTLSSFAMWQYSSTGKVNGISTAVDLDYSYKDYSKIITPRTTAASRRSGSGWQTDGTNYWYVEDDGTIPTSTWLTVNGKTYYVDSNGYRVTGWVKIGGKFYYFRASTGVMQTGWLNLNGKKYYLDSSTGARKTGWLTLDGETYYLRKSSSPAGRMATGWLKISGKYYYFDEDTGAMQTGWTTIDGQTFYLDADTGVRVTGWLELDGETYFLRKGSSPVGVRASGWVKISGKYYYFDPDTGAMHKGLLTIGSKTYYLDAETGVRKTGWVTVDGNTYYFRKKSGSMGVMATGWVKISGKYYYFDKTTGVMLTNTTIGKYILGSDGVCTNRS
ncbi:MAG: cell wall-binding protein [Lachnospiraceae bacterium]|nr:cell wall-binding protein [Lachnospiraceae bacterium]